jgi:hypothetical protein
MKTIFEIFLRICILQKKPQDLPASAAFLGIVTAMYLATGFILVLSGDVAGSALLTSLLDTVLMLLVTYGLLILRNHPQRWLQTSTALAGTGVIFNLIATPLLFNQGWSGLTDAAQVLVSILVLILFIWNIAVIAYIYSHALSLSFPAGVLVAISYVWLAINLINMMLPQQLTA